METVKNLGEAMDFFILNSSGSVKCVKDDNEKICDSYLEAVEFYNQNLM